MPGLHRHNGGAPPERRRSTRVGAPHKRGAPRRGTPRRGSRRRRRIAKARPHGRVARTPALRHVDPPSSATSTRACMTTPREWTVVTALALLSMLGIALRHARLQTRHTRTHKQNYVRTLMSESLREMCEREVTLSDTLCWLHMVHAPALLSVRGSGSAI